MPYALIGESQRGKTHFAKELIKKLQNESTIPSIIMLLVSFDDEWKPAQQNSDSTLYLKRGNQIKLYDKSKKPYKTLLEQLTRDAFSDENKKKYKIIFIDDNTTDMNNRDPLLTKIYTEGRHRGIDIIQALHYINSIYVNIKAFIRDFVLFGPQIHDKMKSFYKSTMSQHFDKKGDITDDGDSVEGYDFDVFQRSLDNWMEQHFHNAIQIKLPTKQDTRALIQYIQPDKQYEQIISTNGLWKLLV